MEDLPERSNNQPQSEQQPSEPEPIVAAASPTPEPSPSTEAVETPSQPRPAPTRPAKPTGPRIADLQPGKVVEGKVTRIERYGAFVDLGLVEKRDGLIHISELAPYRVRRVEDVVKVGDEIRARVVSVDLGRGRIALSLNDVDSEENGALPATTTNEPTLTAMAAAFERAYGRLREKEERRKTSGPRENEGDRKRREQQMLMEKLRTSGR